MGKKLTFYPFYILTWVLSEMLALPFIVLVITVKFRKEVFIFMEIIQGVFIFVMVIIIGIAFSRLFKLLGSKIFKYFKIRK